MSSDSPVRLMALADSVFAFAITLLVMDIRLPEDTVRPGDLGVTLWRLWPSFLSYVISFVVIGIMWINHRRMMQLIDRIDAGFINLTLLLLLCIAFLPFPTAVMMDHLTDPHERAVAVAFYCGCITLTAVVYCLGWWHAARDRRLIASHVPQEAVRGMTRVYAPAPFLYLTATLLAFAHVALSLSIVVALGILYIQPRIRAHSAIGKSEAGAGQ